MTDSAANARAPNDRQDKTLDDGISRVRHEEN